jgi:hypothetical protein
MDADASWVPHCVQRYAEMLSRELWAKLGAEHDAYVTVDRYGTALPDGAFRTDDRTTRSRQRTGDRAARLDPGDTPPG